MQQSQPIVKGKVDLQVLWRLIMWPNIGTLNHLRFIFGFMRFTAPTLSRVSLFRAPYFCPLLFADEASRSQKAIAIVHRQCFISCATTFAHWASDNYGCGGADWGARSSSLNFPWGNHWWAVVLMSHSGIIAHDSPPQQIFQTPSSKFQFYSTWVLRTMEAQRRPVSSAKV
jgi:hypothetical protein